jgi:hypothetical protein
MSEPAHRSHVRKTPSSAHSLINWRTSCRMLTNRAIVAQACIGWARASATRSIGRLLERDLCRGDAPGTLPGWCGGDRGRRGNDPRRLPQYLPPGRYGATGAMGADERLPRLVPRQSSELFEKLSLPGAPLLNRTVDLLLTITTAPRTERTSCTDSTGNRTDSIGGAGIAAVPFHEPFHGQGPCVLPAGISRAGLGPAAPPSTSPAAGLQISQSSAGISRRRRRSCPRDRGDRKCRDIRRGLSRGNAGGRWAARVRQACAPTRPGTRRSALGRGASGRRAGAAIPRGRRLPPRGCGR